MKKYLSIGFLSCALIILAQSPLVNIDRHKHGNLWSAQTAVVEAYQKIDLAQQSNKDQVGGHAQKAKDLLREADQEIKLAAEYANRH